MGNQLEEPVALPIPQGAPIPDTEGILGHLHPQPVGGFHQPQATVTSFTDGNTKAKATQPEAAQHRAHACVNLSLPLWDTLLTPASLPGQ